MEFNIGDKVRLPGYNIDFGVITGIEQYKDWDFDEGGMYDHGEVSYDYQITYVESGEIIEEWYSESWLESLTY